MNAVLDWPVPTPADTSGVDLLKRAKALLKVIRGRETQFGVEIAAILGDPAYEMLLDLYVAHRTGTGVNVTSACIGCGVPVTTGLRLIEQLVVAGAIYRMDDARDRRRRLVTLTDLMVAAIERNLSALNL